MVQVIIQTALIVDGLRRCSDGQVNVKTSWPILDLNLYYDIKNISDQYIIINIYNL